MFVYILPVPAIYIFCLGLHFIECVCESGSDWGIAEQSSGEKSHRKHEKATVPGAQWTMIRCKLFQLKQRLPAPEQSQQREVVTHENHCSITPCRSGYHRMSPLLITIRKVRVFTIGVNVTLLDLMRQPLQIKFVYNLFVSVAMY